jgi:hypothetical protein
MNSKPCVFCGEKATEEFVHDETSLLVFTCQSGCPEYCIDRVDQINEFGRSSRGLTDDEKKQIGMLLRERSIIDKRKPLLWKQKKPNGNANEDIAPVNIDEILRAWPANVLERLDRCLCSLIERANQNGNELAQKITISRPGHPESKSLVQRLLSLCRTQDEGMNLLWMMRSRSWIEFLPNEHSPSSVSVLPAGWERYESLNRGNRNNPAFVAMWFGRPKADGGSDRSAEMTALFTNSIEAACIAAGWTALRVDMVEHNDSVIDRIIYEIRRAPFVIADLTENNQGVYFEAGYAKGLGREVIYCCPSGAKAHFDVDSINHVKYSNPDELRKKLENRILGTVGEGPKYKRDRTNEA